MKWYAGLVGSRRRAICSKCPTPCEKIPTPEDLKSVCPINSWPERNLVGLGDAIEAMAKPAARMMGMRCLDESGKLRPESGCAKRRDALNRIHFST